MIGFPGHPDAEGVTVYVAVPCAVPEFVSICEIDAPEPALAPEIPAPLPAVHVNVVPEVKLLRLIAVEAPEQIVADEGVAVAKGTGLTVITTGTAGPVQELADGTIL